MEKDEALKERTDVVYYFKCEKCKCDIFWSEIKPSVLRAARVFKWVRAGCPNDDCDNHITLSAPDKIYERQEALELFNEINKKGARVYWV